MNATYERSGMTLFKEVDDRLVVVASFMHGMDVDMQQLLDNQAVNAALLEALEDARNAIDSLDECALGIATGSDGFQWPIKVELLNKINKAIRIAKEK